MVHSYEAQATTALTNEVRSLRANLHNPSTSRERLLDAAEELFADYGFNGVSVRQIVEAAKVNLGAIPYHFGTKENLFKQVIYRRPFRCRKSEKHEFETSPRAVRSLRWKTCSGH